MGNFCTSQILTRLIQSHSKLDTVLAYTPNYLDPLTIFGYEQIYKSCDNSCSCGGVRMLRKNQAEFPTSGQGNNSIEYLWPISLYTKAKEKRKYTFHWATERRKQIPGTFHLYSQNSTTFCQSARVCKFVTPIGGSLGCATGRKSLAKSRRYICSHKWLRYSLKMRC